MTTAQDGVRVFITGYRKKGRNDDGQNNRKKDEKKDRNRQTNNQNIKMQLRLC